METPPETPDAPLGDAGDDAGEVISIRRIQVFNLVLTAVGTLVGLWLSRRFALGVLLGGLVMAANFKVMAAVLRSVFLKGSTSPVNVGLYWVKFAGLMLLVGVLVVKFRVDAIGLLCGLGAIFIAITMEAVLRLIGW
ncbi:ATP synthase subunit I [Deferrisoma camini]|uniref:ATP synthase subunit I n=1 Tax=Deferrisoma camini TaxID=1035120 RepID=UPI00046D4084|nr:ATP synthase subunit I [Deferrisoma camini]